MRRRFDEEWRGGVVGIHDGDPRPGTRQALGGTLVAESPEEAELRLAICLERAVQLQVLVSQVGEDGHVIGDLRHSAQRQAMRRGFHDRGLVAGLDHGPQDSLQLRGLGCGDVLRIGRAYRAHLLGRRCRIAGGDAGGLQNGRGQERGGGLAVSPGDADHSQFAARVAVPPGGHGGQCAARILDHDLRQGRPRYGPLHDGDGGAEFGRGRHEVMAVRVEAGHSHEDGRRPDEPRVEGDASDLQRTDAGPEPRLARHSRGLDGTQTSGGFQPFDQPTQEPGRGGLGRSQKTRHRFVGKRHSDGSSAGACGRPRTLRMP